METDHDRIESILMTALEMDSKVEQQEYVRRACGSDTRLHSRINELIENHRRAGNFLEVQDQDASAAKPIQEQVGGRVGPYLLIEQIGVGGFGLVFRAEQQTPIRRVVALKVIKPGLDSAQIFARFEIERQALALMDHSNIAHVLDCGQTPSGRPYFVMELIRGVPITEYCDQHHLTPRQRLELFIPVCHAVQHAHQKGIIHRDLKPSNVLVTEVDGRPIPKVIDFGVAKAIGSACSTSLNTHIGDIIGTLEYMSPEQAVPNHQDIDTRSDVYCLGVLLYELLTGTTPLQRKKLKDAAILEVLRIIREVEPHTPSTRLSAIEELPSVAANRSVEPRTLSSVIKGDLDWIVMKSLDKDRNQRYSTASGLARDIEHFLRDEPVEAGPPGLGYRMRKYFRRNRGPVLVALVLLLTLIGGVVGTLLGLFRAQQGWTAADLSFQAAQHQRDRAERHYQQAMSAVERLLTRVGGVSLESAPHLDETRCRILEDALEFYREILLDEVDDPVVRREVGMAHQRIGDIQTTLARYQQAEESLKQAIDVHRQLIDEFPSDSRHENDFVQSHRQLAIVFFKLGRIPEAERLVVNMLNRDRIAEPEHLREQFLLYYLRSWICKDTLRPEEALSASEKALELVNRLLLVEPAIAQYQAERANVLNFLGILYRESQRLADSERCLQEAQTTLKRFLANEPGDIYVEGFLAFVCSNLGLTLASLNRQPEAAAAYEEGIALFGQLARNHPTTPEYKWGLAKAHNNVALLHSKFDDSAQAATENEKSLKIFEELMRLYPERLEFAGSFAGGCGNQAKYLIEQRRWEESLVWNTNAIAAAENLLKIEPRHSETRRVLHNSLIGRAGTYRKLKQFDLAIKDYRRSLEFSKGEHHPNYVNFRPRALAYAGEHAAAAAEAEAIATNVNATGSNFQEMAKVLSTCVSAAENDSEIEESERANLAENYAVRAVELLAKAAENGRFPTRDSIADLRNDERLQPIQDRDDFKKLLSELESAIQSKDSSQAVQSDKRIP